MYQYTTTNVINSQYALDYNGNRLVNASGSDILKYEGSSAGLLVNKIGFFKTANILSIHKRLYSASIKEIAEITIPTISSGLIARLDIVLKLSQSTQSEYTNYSLDFLKPITVEVTSSGTAATDATALVAQLNLLKDRFGKEYFKAEVNSSTKVRITCKEDVQRVKSMIISKSAASYNSTIQPEYENVSSTTFTIVTNGAIGFGTDDWMSRKVMLPSADNTRFFGISKDERPIPGGNYSEYILRYSITKENDGIVSGNTSITTHVFWVKSDLIASFEVALVATTKPIISISTDQVFSLTVTNNNTHSPVINILGIVPFVVGISEITVVTSDADVVEIDTVTVGTPSTTQVGSITTLHNQAGTATVTVTIDGVSHSISVTTIDFALDYQNDEYLDTNANDTDQITAVGNIGAITYASDQATRAGVGASTGLVTTVGKTATGAVVITATDSTGETATLTYEIVELVLAYTVDGTLSTGGDESDQIVVTGDVGTVTFVSDQPTRATVSATGLVETAGVIATGNVVITATDGTSGAVKTISYTIAA